MYRVRAYLKYLLKSTNHHGVHSPFVYNLVTKCFYAKSSLKDKQFVRDYKQQLLNSKETIIVTDFGAGSRVFKSNQRAVSKIAKVAALSEKNALLLMRMVSYLNLNSILELGTSLGVATASMAFANPKANLVSLEGCEATSRVANEQFSAFNLNPIEQVVGEFSETLPDQIEKRVYDLIYFDGNHSKEATLTYFKSALTAKHNASVFIFDDIHWSQEMTEAWNEIKNHSEVTVSIDTFQWGIVFFRKEQRKEHFIIRL